VSDATDTAGFVTQLMQGALMDGQHLDRLRGLMVATRTG
jgi:hypothetical protein